MREAMPKSVLACFKLQRPQSAWEGCGQQLAQIFFVDSGIVESIFHEINQVWSTRKAHGAMRSALAKSRPFELSNGSVRASGCSRRSLLRYC